MAEIKRGQQRGHLMNKSTQTTRNKRVHCGVQTEKVCYAEKGVQVELLRPSMDGNLLTKNNGRPSLTTEDCMSVSDVKHSAIGLEAASQKTKTQQQLNRTHIKNHLQDPTLINSVVAKGEKSNISTDARSEKAVSLELSQTNKSNVLPDADTMGKAKCDLVKNKKHLLIYDSSDTESVDPENILMTTSLNNLPVHQNTVPRTKKIKDIDDMQESFGNISETDNTQVTSTKHSGSDCSSIEEVDTMQHLFAGKLKKRRCHRVNFSEEDRRNIVRYILKGGCRFESLGGIEYWKMMEISKVCPEHTWQSIKEHFRKRICPVLGPGGLTKQNLEKYMQINS